MALTASLPHLDAASGLVAQQSPRSRLSFACSSAITGRTLLAPSACAALRAVEKPSSRRLEVRAAGRGGFIPSEHRWMYEGVEKLGPVPWSIITSLHRPCAFRSLGLDRHSPGGFLTPSPWPRSSGLATVVSSRGGGNSSLDDDEDDELDEARDLNFFQRLARAWRILFPPPQRPPSNAEIARERLRVVLYTDRGEVSPEVKRLLRNNIIEAISTYVEIESEEDVRLSVSADPSLGTVYSVTIPVRRVKPEFQEYWSDSGFRDRFYEEILRERGVIEGAGGGVSGGIPRMRVEAKLLNENEE